MKNCACQVCADSMENDNIPFEESFERYFQKLIESVPAMAADREGMKEVYAEWLMFPNGRPVKS